MVVSMKLIEALWAAAARRIESEQAARRFEAAEAERRHPGDDLTPKDYRRKHGKAPR